MSLLKVNWYWEFSVYQVDQNIFGEQSFNCTLIMERKSLWYLILLSPSLSPLSSVTFLWLQVKKNIDMSNIFPRERGRPSESVFILNVTNLPQEKTNGVLLRLLAWNLWKDTTDLRSVLRPCPQSCSGTQLCPCLSPCRISIASSKSQNSSVSYYLYIK